MARNVYHGIRLYSLGPLALRLVCILHRIVRLTRWLHLVIDREELDTILEKCRNSMTDAEKDNVFYRLAVRCSGGGVVVVVASRHKKHVSLLALVHCV